MWARSAEETCRERPPRKIARRRIHLVFSRTVGWLDGMEIGRKGGD
jgi:hypothetical protein